MAAIPREIAVLIGTRPEAVKLSPVIRELTLRDKKPRVILTGQHRELLDPLLNELEIQPDIQLKALSTGQDLGGLAGRLLDEISSHFSTAPPEWLVVQGDTSSAAMGALAAFYGRIPVAHVEAGLRTHDSNTPFPEEINRRLIADVAQLHFAPTETARKNLLAEGIVDERIHVVGNTVVDCLRHASEVYFKNPESKYSANRIVSNERRLVFVTCHRRESLAQDLAGICRGLRAMAEQFGDAVKIVFPMHRNPEVRDVVERHLNEVDHIQLVEPLGYLDTIANLRQARLVITDSGGVLEEAATLGVPTLIVRRACERPEAMEAGVARLIRPQEDDILKAARQLLSSEKEHQQMAKPTEVFGDGHAAERMVEVLLQEIQQQE